MDVVFPVMPFADVGRPVVGVSLLHAAARRLGALSRVLYLNLAFADRVGILTYAQISSGFPPDALVGEWFFADILFGTEIPDADRYLSDILSKYPLSLPQMEQILQARRHRDSFIMDCVRQIVEHRPSMVGFSTTFHQTCACLAVATRLKELPNPPLIIFGGANCEGEMGAQLLASFKCIDYISTHEADESFPLFLRNFLENGEPAPMPGIIGRGEKAVQGPSALVEEMDRLPIPEYADYFEALEAASFRAEITPELLMETSRGCWWGEKHHCTFCGLNGEAMAFRRKSEARVLEEMALLAGTYNIKRIQCVDNILDVRFIHTLFPKLAESGLDVELFFEVKANLNRDQLAILRRGGMRCIQPGIESFSTEILRLMRKGCTGMQNIQLLRWCQEIGLEVAWNLLTGFPGENRARYAEMARVLPLLVHLPAPASSSVFRMDRFSPYYTEADAFGLSRVRPNHAYFYVFPFGRRELSRLAYFFEFDYGDRRNPSEYTEAFSQEVQKWVASRWADPAQPPRLDAFWADGGFDIVDSRPGAVAPRFRLEGLDAELYLACDSARGLSALTSCFAGKANVEQIRERLEHLLRNKLLVELDRQYLSLAVFRQRPVRLEDTVHEAALTKPL